MQDSKKCPIAVCLCCLRDKRELQSCEVRDDGLKTILQVGNLWLCYLCKRILQRMDIFVQNVKSNQILLENFFNLTDSTLQSARDQCQLINLSKAQLDIIELGGTEEPNIEESFSVTYNRSSNKDVMIKLELKEDDNLFVSDRDADDDFDDNNVKEEDDFPLKDMFKEELHDIEVLGKSMRKMKGQKKKRKKVRLINNTEFDDDNVKEEDDFPLLELDGIDLKVLRKSGRIKGPKTKSKEEESTNYTKDAIKIKKIHITREQCMEERRMLAQDKKYLSSAFKCEDCIKGFNFKDSYEKHMEKHSEARGPHECDICKLRVDTEEKLICHKRYHELRYKCGECELTRVCRLTIKDHYTAVHRRGVHQYTCPDCPKTFNREVSLRKHTSYAHRGLARAACAHCPKSYANREVLKAHMMQKHPNEVTAETVKRHECEHCGLCFRAPSLLVKHSIKHSLVRSYYCVECDKSFKTDSALKQHLKTALPHITYVELPLQCLYCEKRFAVRRDVERHMNRVHLNIKPYKCNLCDKAYVNGWSLNEHKRFAHEGQKRPLKYPCSMCDKVFDRNQTLKGHIRTHTGERPFQCTKCPAKFSQAGILGTHVKLVHLKLTRDGRPKTLAVK